MQEEGKIETSVQDATDSLAAIDSTTRETVKSVTAVFSGPVLILWGIVTILGYIGTHFWLEYVWQIWIGLSSVAMALNFLMHFTRYRCGLPTKITNAGKLGLQEGIFWGFVFMFMTVWLNLLKPYTGLQLNAFIVTVIAFAYIQMGIFYKSYRYMIALGITMCFFTLTGYYIIPHAYYCLWMAGTVGGIILLTGLYFQMRARKYVAT